MLITDFIKEYEKTETEKRTDFIKENVHFTDYIPFIEKDAYARNIIKASMYDGQTGRINVKSSVRYHLFCRTVINIYTDLEGSKDFINEYDDLNRTGALNVIMSLINQDDLNQFKMIVDMAYQDVLTNEYETHAFISKEVERASNVIGTILNPVIKELSKQLESLDEEKIEKITKVIESANRFKKK